MLISIFRSGWFIGDQPDGKLIDGIRNLRSHLEKSNDADLLREMTSFAVEKGMPLKVSVNDVRRKEGRTGRVQKNCARASGEKVESGFSITRCARSNFTWQK
ncbi:hypothetical protein [uncultured Martelella sp.]|uniref:hypothetical protein n=1 Tax=uncultured Martelella sp. TaxID=392331 RepID=UPI0029C97BD5|nr:hypothetical protein [uncultured Martelella sp.]